MTGIVVLALFRAAFVSVASTPKAVRGHIDVSSWDFSKGALKLDGEWELYFDQLLEPADFAGGRAPELTGYVNVPGSWQNVTGAARRIPRHGVATFRLVVTGLPSIQDGPGLLQPTSHAPWMLEIPYARTAYRLWVNGEFLASNGVVSTDPAEMRPEYQPTLAPVRPVDATGGAPVQQAGTLEIVMQISNAHIRTGGLPKNVRLGLARDLPLDHQQRLMIQMLWVGALGLMAVVNGLLYAGRRSERSMLYFALLSADIAVRSFFTGDLPVATVWPDFPWELQLRIEYITGYVGPALFLLCLDSLYPRDVNRWMTRLHLAIGVVGCAITVLFPVRISSIPIPYQIAALVLSFPYVVVVLTRAAFKGREASMITLFGSAICATLVVLTMFHYSQLSVQADLVAQGIFVLLLSQALALSQRYSQAFRRVSELAEQNGVLLEVTRRRFAERDRLYRLLTEQDEKTRRRIAEALHGGAQARLSQAARLAQQAAQVAKADPAEAAKLMHSVHDLVEHVRETDIREASHRLHPAAISAGLVAALDVLCNRFVGAAAVDFEVDPRLAELDDPGGPGLKENLRLGLYRIAEEALGNAQRHAGAGRIALSLRVIPAEASGPPLALASPSAHASSSWIEMVVTDDGKGFDPGAARQGLGMQLIAARVADLGGEWEIDSAPGHGTRLRVVVPLARADFSPATTARKAAASHDAGLESAL